MRSCLLLALGALATELATVASAPDNGGAARTADVHPDLSGTYDVATLTPLVRPAKYGDQAFLTREEAARIAASQKTMMALADLQSDPDRSAPPAGGDGTLENVGNYNAFWI